MPLAALRLIIRTNVFHSVSNGNYKNRFLRDFTWMKGSIYQRSKELCAKRTASMLCMCAIIISTVNYFNQANQVQEYINTSTNLRNGDGKSPSRQPRKRHCLTTGGLKMATQQPLHIKVGLSIPKSFFDMPNSKKSNKWFCFLKHKIRLALP